VMNSPRSPGTGVRVGTPVAIKTSPAVVRRRPMSSRWAVAW
jgi:hypothetical protein